MKKEIPCDSVYAQYYCDNCEIVEKDVPVQKSIYCGAPCCDKCNIEMSLDKLFIKS